jgi:hypothetical protein
LEHGDFDGSLKLEMKIYKQDGTSDQDSIEDELEEGILSNWMEERLNFDYLTDEDNQYLTQVSYVIQCL